MLRTCGLTLLALCSVSGNNNYGGGYNMQQEPVRVNYKQEQRNPSYSHSYNGPAAPQFFSGPSYQHRAQREPEMVKISFSSGGSTTSYGSNSPHNMPSSYSQSTKSYGNNAPAQVSISYSDNNNGNSYGGGSSYSSYGSSSSEQNSAILKHNQFIEPGNSHQFDYSTSNGISHSETTSVKQSYGSSYGYGYGGSNDNGNTGATITKSGQFSYTSPEGQPISLSYNADEGGFQAQGAHLPVAPRDSNAGYSHSSSFSSSSTNYAAPTRSSSY